MAPERFVIWLAFLDDEPVAVPDHVIMQLARLRQYRGNPDTLWEIRAFAPPPEPTGPPDWYRALAIETEVERFQRQVAWIMDKRVWPQEFLRPPVEQWAVLRDALPELPALELSRNNGNWREPDCDRQGWLRDDEEVIQANLSAMAQACEDLERAMAKRRRLVLRAFRFGLEGKLAPIALLWHHPWRWLMVQSLPILKREDWQSEKTIGLRNTTLDEVMDRVTDKYHNTVAMVFSANKESADTEKEACVVITRGYLKRFQETEERQHFKPYSFQPALLYWKGSALDSQTLSDADSDNLQMFAGAIDAGHVSSLWDLVTDRHPLVLSTLEDSGIWQEYFRILRTFTQGQNSSDLGTIQPAQIDLPVTAFYGATSFALWEFARLRSRSQSPGNPDLVTCPSCGRQWPRAKGKRRSKLCDQCANPNLRRVRKCRSKAMTSMADQSAT